MNLRLLAAALALSSIACSGKPDESTAPSDTAASAASAPVAAQGTGIETRSPCRRTSGPHRPGLEYAIDRPGAGAEPQRVGR